MTELYTPLLVDKVGQLVVGAKEQTATIMPVMEEQLDWALDDLETDSMPEMPADTGGASASGVQRPEPPMISPTQPVPDVEPTQPTQPAPPPQLKQPTSEQVRLHNLVHVPYQPWCRLCVASRAPDQPHHQIPRTEDPQRISLVEIDYAFLSSGMVEDRTLPILIVHCQKTGHGFGVVARSKGRADGAQITHVLRFLQESGHTGAIRLRSDGEHAIVAVASEIAARRHPAETAVETTAPGSAGSLGGADRWAGLLGGLVRCLRKVVEEKWHVRIGNRDAIFPWLVLHASWLYNRFQDTTEFGMPPFEVLHRRPYKGVVYPLAEAILARNPFALSLPKLRDRWQLALWLGRTVLSDAHVVGTSTGVMVTRSVRPAMKDDKTERVYAEMQWTP